MSVEETTAPAPAEPLLKPVAIAVSSVVGVALLAYVVTSLLGGATQSQTALGEAAYLVPILATVVCSSLVASRLHAGFERRFWGYLALASLLLLLNEGFYSGRMILGLSPEFGDTTLVPLAAGLVASLLILLVLLLLVRPAAGPLPARLRATADGAIAVLLLTLALQALVIDPGTVGEPYSASLRLLAAFRVATGLLMVLGVGFAAITPRAVRMRPFETLLLAGIGVYGAGLVLWPLWFAQTAQTPDALLFYGVPFLFMAGQAFAAVAAAIRLGDRELRTFALDRPRPERAKGRPWLVPTAAIGALTFLVVLVEASGDPGARQALSAAVPVAAILLVVRSALLAWEVESREAASVTDPVSGLGTMAGAGQTLARELEVAGRFGSRVSLIVADLDDLGEINDVHGHQEGDRALAAVGDALRAVVSADRTPGIYAARVSGDEFAVIAPDAGQEEAFGIAIKVRSEIGRAAERTGLPLSASMGIAVYPEHASDAAGLFVDARDALAVAKTGEFGRVLWYDPDDAGMRRVTGLDAASYLDTIRVLARSVEQRTTHLTGHGSRVAALAVALGRQLRIDEERLRLLEIAGELHDIGYIGVPDRIVEKPGPLDASELLVVQGHPDMGTRILASVDLPEVLPWVRAHHERWDGRGYPRGLSGSEIPLGARILAVCDAYDAMTHDRPYRRALRHGEALEELGMGRGSAFDPGTVDEFFFMLKAGDIAGVTHGE